MLRRSLALSLRTFRRWIPQRIPPHVIERHPKASIHLLPSYKDYLCKRSFFSPTVPSSRATEALLEQPVGSLTPSQWSQAETLLFQWTRQPCAESVGWAWKLLDRLSLEQRQVPSSSSTLDFLSTHEWVPRAVDAWCLCGNDSLSPTQVLQKLDFYAPLLKPDRRTCHAIMDWAMNHVVPSKLPVIMQQVLERTPRPDTAMYHKVIRAWSNSGLPQAPQQAESLLRDMQADPNVSLMNHSYTAVITAWARSRQAHAPQRAEALLHEMSESSSIHVYPNTNSFTAVLNAWSKSDEPGAAQRALAILEQMELLYKAGIKPVKPNVYSYTTVVSAFAKTGDARAAESVVNKLLQAHETTGDADLIPNTILFSALIGAWSKSQERKAAQQAERVVQQMQDLVQSGNPECEPNTITFNSVIAAWANSRDADAGEKAEEVLERMYQANVQPNRITFTSIINAWARSSHDDAAERAEQVLRKMQTMHASGVAQEVNPDTYTFTSVISAWARHGGPQGALKAEALLQEMKDLVKAGDVTAKPNNVTCNSVIDAWAKSGDKHAGERAEAILRGMQALHKAGYSDIEPDIYSYTCVMDANRHAVERMEAILDEMQTAGIQPSVVHFNSLITAWAKQGNVRKAEAVLQNMHQANLKPNTGSFNAILAGWSKQSGDPSAAKRTKGIVRRMQELNRSGYADTKPDTVSFICVIEAFCKSGDPRAAEAVLREMHQLQNAGDADVKATAACYTSVMKAYALCGAAEQAESILKQMLDDRDVSVDAHAFKVVIDAWATSEDPLAGERAEAVLRQMQERQQLPRAAELVTPA